MSWSDTAGLLLAHLKKRTDCEYRQHTASRQPATLKPLTRWLWNSDMEQRYKPAAISKLCYPPLLCLLSWPPKINVPMEIFNMMVFQDSFVTMCKLTDEIFLPTIPWIHPLAEIWLSILAGEAAGFSWRCFFPLCDKKCLNDGTLILEIWKNTFLSTSASWHEHNDSIILFNFYSEQANF